MPTSQSIPDDLWLVFPLGPDKNSLHGVGTARWGRWLFLKPEVKEWRDIQRARLGADGVVPQGFPAAVEIHSHYPVGSRWGDVDHQLVNILDTLSGAVLVDDSWLWHITATICRDAKDEPWVDVFILWGADE